MKRSWWTSRSMRLGAILLGVAALIEAGFAMDDPITRLVAKPSDSGQLNSTIGGMRFLGDAVPVVLLTLLACVVAPDRRGPALLALTAALVAGGAVDRAKTVTDRRRPIDTLPAPAAASWTGSQDHGHNSSFPSGHTAAAFAYARGMSLAFPATTPIAYLAATGTGVSRVFERRHYPSDCVVGALFGWSVATLLWRAAHRFRAFVANRGEAHRSAPATDAAVAVYSRRRIAPPSAVS